SRLPFAALALDAGVSARALDDVRPAIARGDFSVALLRGPVGMPPPETEHRRPFPRLCAPDAAERDAAVAVHARTLELASDLEIRLSTVSLGAADPDPRLARRDGPWTGEEAADLARVGRRLGAGRRRALDGARFALE